MKILVSSIIDIKKAGHNSRLHQFLVHLSKTNEITVICLNDTWKLQYDSNCYRFQNSYSELFNRIDIKYLTKLSIPPFIQDIASLFFIPKLIKQIKHKKFDVHFNYNGLFSSYLIAKILRIYNIHTIYDVADDLPSMSFTSPQIPSSLRGLSYALSSKVFIKNIHFSTKITITTKQLSSLYAIPEKKVRIIPNGVDNTLFYKRESKFKRKHALEGFFVVGFVGVLREWIEINPFLDALVELVKEYNIKAVIVGDGICSAKIKKSVSEKSLSNYVIFTGAVNYDEVPDVVNSFNVGIIPFSLDSVSQNAVPLKLFEYIACGVSVISSPLKSIKSLFPTEIFYANSPEDYIKILKTLYKDNEEKKTQRKNTLNKYTWSRFAADLEKILVENKHESLPP